MNHWLIRNPERINEGHSLVAHLRVCEGRVAQIGAGLALRPVEQAIEEDYPGCSPFAGRTFRPSIAATWVYGYRVWDSQRLPEEQMGKRQEFDR